MKNNKKQPFNPTRSGLVRTVNLFAKMTELACEYDPSFNLEAYKIQHEKVKKACKNMGVSSKAYERGAEQIYQHLNKLKLYTVFVDKGGEMDQYQFESTLVGSEFEIECKKGVSEMINEKYPNETFTIGSMDSKEGIIGFYVNIGGKGKIKGTIIKQISK